MSSRARKTDLSVIGHRTVTDEHRQTWHIWEVHPTPSDRRGVERRRHGETAAEERRRKERRAIMDRRALIDPELASGWLALQSGKERRRFAPIPPDWLRMSTRDLLKLLNLSKRVVPLSTVARNVPPPTSSAFGPYSQSRKRPEP